MNGREGLWRATRRDVDSAGAASARCKWPGGRWWATLLNAVAVCLVLVCGGCGAGRPGSAVASVAGIDLSRQAVEHWAGVFDRTEQATASQAITPIPPTSAQCVLGREDGKRCSRRYLELREAAFGFLIHGAWLAAEAHARHLQISPRLVGQELERVREQQFPEPGSYHAYLERSGQTEADIRYRVLVDLLLGAIERRVVSEAPAPSQAEVSDYFRANRSSFLTAERRWVSTLLLPTERAAERALGELTSGSSFAAVESRLERDGAKAVPRTRVLVAEAEPRLLAKAAFHASPGRPAGPVRTAEGVYVFEVSKVAPPVEETLAEAAPRVRQQLLAVSQQHALSVFSASFATRWRAHTSCSVEFKVSQYCSGTI